MKIGLHYSFQVATNEHAQDVMQQGLEDIAAADRDGFSSVVFAEHHFLDDGWLPRPLQLAAAAAAVTKTMRVGTDIVVLALHHPVAVAEEAAVVDILSGGRFILGVGLGWIKNEFDGFGVPYKGRAAIYEQSLDIVKRLLKGETVSSAQGHYRFHGARIRPLPVNPNGVPLWMGALADPALPRIARMGDAWVMPPGTKLKDLVRQKSILTEARAAAGLPMFKEQPLRREAFVAETDEKAWELYAQGLRHEYGDVYRPLHPTYPGNDTLDNLRKWGEDVFVVGSPPTVADELRRYQAEIGATECLVRFQLPGVPRGAIRDCLLGFREVMSILNRD
ncbi:MAG: LLM class flavin-dependent oxidoreductase [Acidimicrobiia bacterium]|nr:LLM class flavin-dependent oxidoreductase [Acidimicrobiia bacterium]